MSLYFLNNPKSNSRILRRIARDFTKRKLLGDIPVNEEEYEFLKFHARQTILKMEHQTDHVISDRVFVVALVQIGIRVYDGNFWWNLFDEIDLHGLPLNRQSWIAHSFIRTMKNYKRSTPTLGRFVETVLMHGFVCNAYANAFFSFLFEFYRLDLDRNPENIDKSNFKNLLNIIARNDKTQRTNLITEHTAQAVKFNLKGAGQRIRRYIHEIDVAMFEEEGETRGSTRILHLLIWWTRTDSRFLSIKEDPTNARGPKRFSSPSLLLNWVNSSFYIQLPSQAIPADQIGTITWRIERALKIGSYPVDSFQIGAYGMRRCDPMTLSIDPVDLFGPIKIDLLCQDKSLKKYRIPAAEIRYFAKDGKMIGAMSFKGGEMWALSVGNPFGQPPGWQEKTLIAGLTCNRFEFQTGDLLLFSNGKAISIGGEQQERLIGVTQVWGAQSISAFGPIPIYRSSPTVFIFIREEALEGTYLEVNGKRHRVDGERAKKVDFSTNKETPGYLIKLHDYGVELPNIYDVRADVPNDQKRHHWQFALLNDFEFAYEDAPYVFSSRGTIRFNERLVIVPPRSVSCVGLPGGHSFNFEMDPQKITIDFEIIQNEKHFPVELVLPVLRWRMDEGTWEIEQPNPIWFRQYPKVLDFTGPFDEVSVDFGELNDEQLGVKVFTKYKSTDIISCDLTYFMRFKTHERDSVRVNLWLNRKKWPFLEIMLRSRVLSHTLSYDDASGRLLGEFEIFGQGKYYADISHTVGEVGKHIPIINGGLSVETDLAGGTFHTAVYEEESDDSGFSDEQGYPIAEFSSDILNPNNLSNRIIRVSRVRRIVQGQISNYVSLRYNPVIILSKKEKGIDYTYQGMIRLGQDEKKCRITFGDVQRLAKVSIEIWDEEYDEYTQLLYDRATQRFVAAEDMALSPSQRYRQYSVLSDDVYQIDAELANLPVV